MASRSGCRPLSSSIGDANKAIADAAVKIEQTYTMPDRHHNPMEPHVTLAAWDEDGNLTLYDSTQMVVGTRKLVSLVLGIPEEKINVVCEYLGGGFGGKSWSWPHTLLAALAAKVVNRPVRLQLTRADMYSMVGHQAATVQTIALGADHSEQADRHPPRQRQPDLDIRRLRRICRHGQPAPVVHQRRNFHEP